MLIVTMYLLNTNDENETSAVQVRDNSPDTHWKRNQEKSVCLDVPLDFSCTFVKKEADQFLIFFHFFFPAFMVICSIVSQSNLI